MISFRPLRIFIAALALATSAVSLAAQGKPQVNQESTLLAHWESHPKPPVNYVVECFQRGNHWVFLGEYHRVRQDINLVLDLIPVLHRNTEVRCLALEFLTREGTEEANRLVTQATFDRYKAMEFFRRQDTTWDYEEYFDILETVWRSNRELGASRGYFRLVGLQPAIDWELLNYGDAESSRREKEKQDHYDSFMATALDDQVLSKGVPALIYTGIAHSTAKFKEYWIGTDRQLVRMGNLVYREPYKSRMWFIALHAPFFDSGTRREVYPFNGILDRLMPLYRQDLGFDVVGSPFANLRDRNPSPHSQTAYAFGELFDGYIIHKTPIREYQGITRIPDWINDEAQYSWFWRHIPKKSAGQEYSKIPFSEYRKETCATSNDYGDGFKRRFQKLGNP